MSNVKRLYKIKEESMVCGVCAGISEYLQVDVSIIRLVWLGLSFLWGSGIIIYIIAAIILPDKKDIIKKDPFYNKPYEDVEYHENNSDHN